MLYTESGGNIKERERDRLIYAENGVVVLTAADIAHSAFDPYMCVYSQQPSLGIFVWNILLISPKGEKDSSSSAIVPTRYAVLVETQTRRPTSPKSLSNLQKIRSKGGENEEKDQRVEVKSGTY